MGTTSSSVGSFEFAGADAKALVLGAKRWASDVQARVENLEEGHYAQVERRRAIVEWS